MTRPRVEVQTYQHWSGRTYYQTTGWCTSLTDSNRLQERKTRIGNQFDLQQFRIFLYIKSWNASFWPILFYINVHYVQHPLLFSLSKLFISNTEKEKRLT